jgi:DNA-nicking Smr family endonuclease
MARPPDDDQDARAFAEAMADARKLAGARRLPLTHAPAPGAAPRRSGSVATTAVVPDHAAARLIIEEAGAQWSARADGIDRRFTRRLGAGKLEVAARIDLHGRSRSECERDLDRFLESARANGHRCLLVIHGRGLHSGTDGPALRDAVRAALIAGPHAVHVLACVTAPPPLGGGGATLIWLRR